MSDKFKVKNGLNLPDVTISEQGDVHVDGTNGLQFYHNSAERTAVDTNSTQTLTNKTLTSPAITTPTGIVKGDVGLGNVDNTSDANKPVSTATQTALDLKADLASPALTGNPTAPTQSAGNNSTRIATTAYADALVSDTAYDATSWNGVTGISPSKNAVRDEMELRAPKASPTFSGTITTPLTASRVAIIGASSELAAADTATYPSLTELSYVKGVTSAIQTQLDSKTGITAVDSSKTGTYTAETSDAVIPCDASGGAFTVNLYAASGNSGRRLTIIKTDSSANAVTIDGNSSETINGETTWKLAGQYSTLSIVCDGSNWWIENERVGKSQIIRGTADSRGGSSSGETTVVNYSAAISSVGGDITFTARTTTTGDYYTVNTTGKYCIWVSMKGSGNENAGITVNSSGLSTNPQSLTASQVPLQSSTAPTNGFVVMSTTICLAAGDIVRFQSEVTPTTSASTRFGISRVS